MGYRILGQAAPAAAADTPLFTATMQTVISTITVCNRGASGSAFRVAVRPDGAALANQHYVAHDIPVGSNDTVTLTLGITLDTGDIVTVRGSTGDLSINAFGQEV